MKIFLSFLILLISLSTSAGACNVFTKFNFGDVPKQINKEIPFSIFKDNFGGEKLVIPIEEICNNSELQGSFVSYLFLEGKLSQIFIERANFNDVNLMEYAKKKYGSFSIPTQIDSLNWRGGHFWDQTNARVQYLQINIHEGKSEILEINSKQYEQNLINYSKQVGAWLDQSNK